MFVNLDWESEMNIDNLFILGDRYEEEQEAMYICNIADEFGISYEEAEAFVADMAEMNK